MERPTVLDTGSDLLDMKGNKVGTITDVVFDPMTLVPEWYEVKLGMLGGHHLVPAGTVTVAEGARIRALRQETHQVRPRDIAASAGRREADATRSLQSGCLVLVISCSVRLRPPSFPSQLRSPDRDRSRKRAPLLL